MVDRFKHLLKNGKPKFKPGDIGYPSNDFSPAGTGRIEIIELSGYGPNLNYKVKFLDRPDEGVSTLGQPMIDFMFNTEAEYVLYGQ